MEGGSLETLTTGQRLIKMALTVDCIGCLERLNSVDPSFTLKLASSFCRTFFSVLYNVLFRVQDGGGEPCWCISESQFHIMYLYLLPAFKFLQVIDESSYLLFFWHPSWVFLLTMNSAGECPQKCTVQGSAVGCPWMSLLAAPLNTPFRRISF